MSARPFGEPSARPAAKRSRLLRLGAIATAAGHALYGNVDLWKGVLISIPAVAGVVAGTAVQQRVSERAVAGAFVVLLLASAAVLVF
jgi:uncharacterized membrane protein YfcA